MIFVLWEGIWVDECTSLKAGYHLSPLKPKRGIGMPRQGRENGTLLYRELRLPSVSDQTAQRPRIQGQIEDQGSCFARYLSTRHLPLAHAHYQVLTRGLHTDSAWFASRSSTLSRLHVILPRIAA